MILFMNTKMTVWQQELNITKPYYEDRDLKPTENLLFTITLFPLTSYEQKLINDFI